MVELKLKDTVKLAETSSDMYGDKVATVLTDVKALFIQSTGAQRGTNTEIISSDAHVYLDKNNSEIKGRGYRIEGMYIIANPFGIQDDESWFRIERVEVGQRKLLANDVNNVHAFLKKVAKMEVENVS